MYISYKRLWKLLIDRNMNRQDLRDKTGISATSIAKLGKGANISTDILIRICEELHCDLTDIMELVDGPNPQAVKPKKPATTAE